MSRNNGSAVNFATNGAFMSNRQYNSKDNSVYQKVCVSGSEYYIPSGNFTNADYILVFAGTNDCHNDVTIGEVDSTDVTEFCGALNAICQTLQTRAPKKKIGFITPYLRKNIETKSRLYINAIKNVCAKYSIPVFDNGENGSINWSNTNIVNALTLKDTYHLNEDGMEYVSYKYEQFMRSL